MDKVIAFMTQTQKFSRFGRSTGAEKCSWSPLLLNYFKHDFLLYNGYRLHFLKMIINWMILKKVY
eukprot:UN27246